MAAYEERKYEIARLETMAEEWWETWKDGQKRIESNVGKQRYELKEMGLHMKQKM